MATTNEHPTSDHENDEYVEEEEQSKTPNTLKEFTNALAALNANCNIENILANLPKSVRRRINALKHLQLDATIIESKFFKEVHELECKYQKLYQPLYEKRNTIVNGLYEPNDEEANWPSDDENDEQDDAALITKQLKDKVNISNDDNKKMSVDEMNKINKDESNEKGIPEFWLTIFKNVRLLAEMVQPHDEPILKHLTDIKIDCNEEPMSFTINFHFSSNEYFTNSVLTKYYEMSCYPETDDPFAFEGPEIFKCTGCTINWNKGKNITLKTVKKKQKHKSRGVVRTITKTVQNDSFFNFFTPPTIPDNAKGEDIDEELRSLLTSDFEIGHYIRERIVPRAVLFYTGEGLEDEDDDYEEEEEPDEDDEEEDGDSDGPDGKDRNKVGKDQNCKQQ